MRQNEHSALRESVERAIGEPGLARNLRGQTKAALRLLPLALQRQLACAFVEHALETLHEEKAPEYRAAFLDCIRATERAMLGDGEVEQVLEEKRCALEHSTQKSGWDDDLGWQNVSIGVDGSLLRRLVEVCLAERLPKSSVFKRPRIPSVARLAEWVCHDVAHHVGGPDWGSDDPVLKQEARARGRAASEAEARWQLARILESLSRTRSDRLASEA